MLIRIRHLYNGCMILLFIGEKKYELKIYRENQRVEKINVSNKY